ncbi:MAG TPA: F0F1 ATP synthase subunit epsilon, partial [Candidatus Kapabacteria bacterium]|nr:F0F1 ATP synthase subunit epsilon [Candidatus Kapabacteria bacterium]
MAMTMHVEVVSAERSLFSGTAELVVAPADGGEVGILARHAPMLLRIKPGAVRIKLSLQEQEEVLYVSGGYMEVQPHSVTILSDTAVRAGDLDESKALEAVRLAEEAMNDKASAIDYARA